MARIHKKLGELLLDAKKITEKDLLRALTEQKAYGDKLGKVIVKLGMLSEKEIIDTVSKQLNIPIVDIKNLEIPEDVISLITADMAKNSMVIPVMRRHNVLKLAMVDPLDIDATDEVARHVMMEIEPLILPEGELRQALEKYYGLKTIVEETLDKIREQDLTLEQNERDDENDKRISFDVIEDEPVVRFVNSLLAQALADSASDIHVEPSKDTMRVRMRVDGRLRDVPSPDKKMFLPIVSRIKILAGIDIAKTRTPQDGRFNIREASREVGVRVSTFPTIHGEKVVLRLLDKSTALYGIDNLGFLNDDKEKIKNVLKRPYGFILSTGPTGSGKSTTLYAILNFINSVEKNIVTIEDPVEYTLEGLAQAQVNPRAGLTFESGLRSILRQDPDIIMVGEIRDRETANIAVHSALTGHLVFSTLHTNDAASAVTRLIDMGIEPFLVTSSVTCVIGQRLIRKICPECKESYYPAPSIHRTFQIREDVLLYRGKGCPACKYRGYRGRTGIYEVLVMDDELREMINNRAPSEVLKKRANEKGMRLMRDDALMKVISGMTTLEEALNVVQED
ncbi:MAG: ATPase, T2SS/T4P/T4SS family [Syntrophorhabdaceae bacterium]|nr:Flp pilus assembly complex ATPase component TadA [Syntrophorhabdaceae bacterium]MDD4194875.1 ATPase, T2SS/T4P/T4SS family [Syntrophorhabdaceae bacterium]